MSQPVNREPIMRVLCDESDGAVMRSVFLAEITLETLEHYYEKLKQFNVVFNEFIGNDLSAFVEQFIQVTPNGVMPTGIIWEVDDVGILYLTDIRPGYSALAHFNFWDRRFTGREQLVREMLRYVFDKFEFHRVVAEVALYAKPMLKAVERIGFKLEGRKREAVFYRSRHAQKGEWYDVNLYSILRREVEDVSTAEEN